MSLMQRSRPLPANLDIHPLSGRIGAQIDNVWLVQGST